MKNSARAQHGYSLLEISIVFLILSIFAGGLLQFLSSHQEEQNVALTNERLNEINESIKRFFVQNGYVPCPSRATVAESNAAFGTSSNCNAAMPAGTWEMGSAPNIIRMGVVPFRTLGLSPRYMYDAWGNRIAYGVVKQLAIDNATYTAFITALTDGIIRVLDAPGGSSLVPSSTSVYVVYTLISAGPDRKGGYGSAGTIIAACDATTDDGENCNYQPANNDRIFVDMSINESTTAADYYNDYIRWSTNDDLEIFKKTGL